MRCSSATTRAGSSPLSTSRATPDAFVKQNLAWALGYNLVALPLAAAGAVPPWAAAIGMSLSSLAVAGQRACVSGADRARIGR